MSLVRIRPSSQATGEKCRRASWLSIRHQESDADKERGDTADAYVSIALMGGDEPPPDATEAIALLAWVREFFPKDAQFFVQKPIALVDPRTGETLSKGKPDLLVLYTLNGRKRLVVVDWKTIGQLFAGYLAPPDDSIQQLNYMVAGGLELGADEGQVILVAFDAKRVKPIIGSAIPVEEWWPIIDRIAAVPQVDPEGPEPAASKGKHCETCWQRGKCSAYLLPAFEANQIPAALSPFTGAGRLLTDADALSALEWLEDARSVVSKAKKVMDVVQGHLEAYANTHGPIQRGDEAWGPIETPGRRSGLKLEDLERLEEMGIGQTIAAALKRPSLIMQGEPGVKYDWRKTPVPLTPRAPAAPALAEVIPLPVSPPAPAAAPKRGRGKKGLTVIDSEGQPLLIPPGDDKPTT